MDKILPHVAEIVSPKVVEGSRVAWCGGNNKAFFRPFCQMADDDMFPMPSNLPLTGTEHVQDEISDVLVARNVRHFAAPWLRCLQYTFYLRNLYSCELYVRNMGLNKKSCTISSQKWLSFELVKEQTMNDAQMLEKLRVAFESLSKEKNAIVVSLEEIVHKAGFAKNSKQRCEDLLKKSGEFKLDFKKEDVMVCRKNFKPMEISMNQKNAGTKNTLSLHDRIKTLRDALSQGLYEKDEVVRLALLTAIAGESIFLLGEPGCAKSMIARRIVQAFKAGGKDDVKYFETLLNEYTTPDEVFGNVSLKALNGELPDSKGKEEYRRLTENMLPEADIAFLDEIWKAGSAILNTLLTIVNERKFHNGSKVVDVPLKALFAASNELPAKNQGLEALYDRLVLRLMVSFIKDEDNFFEMVEAPSSSKFELLDDVKKLQITNAELREWKEKIDKVTLSEGAKSVISAIRKELASRNAAMNEADKIAGEMFEVGDRRWKKIVHILKTSAFLNDRTEVDLMDCQLIEYCIWSTEKQQKQVRDIVEKCIKQNGVDCDTAIDEINEQIENFKKKIDEQWYVNVTDPATEKIVTVDRQKCYECTRDGYNDTWYVTVSTGKHSLYNGNYHDVYNSKKSFVRQYSFSKENDKITCYDDYTVKKNPATTHSEFKKLSDIAHEMYQKDFDKEYYAPVVERIQAEIKALKDKKSAHEIPFKANLFANQEYNVSITSKLDGAIRQIEDAKVQLDKQRNCYYKSELSAKLSVGDVILKSGMIYSAEEVESLTDDQKKNVIAVVCIAGEKTYAMGVEQYMGTWDTIGSACSLYIKNKEIPSEYASNWFVPDQDLLSKICENRKTINGSLNAIDNNIFALCETAYWSSSAKDEAAAFYQMFDESCKKDDTTKSHKFVICVIREWTKD